MKKSLLLSSLLCSCIFAATLSQTPEENSLIVYNGSVALVHEKRSLQVTSSDTQLIYPDVANTIEVDSINLKLPKTITLFSQQFRFDHLTHAKLLDAHVGKEVGVSLPKKLQHLSVERATLLAFDSTNALVKTPQGNILTIPSDTVVFSEVPKELITKPSLVWNVGVKNNTQAPLEIDYLIRNIDYSNNYILNVAKNKATLEGWITIDNRSGKHFENTQLHVLAGTINRVYDEPQGYYLKASRVMSEAANEVSHQAHEGYHFYTIPFKVNLSDNEKTQIKFLEKKDIPITRRYVAAMSFPLYLRGENEQSVTQSLELSKLDIVLPKGTVRTYSKLQKNSVLLGESALEHMPKNTPINLKLGTNFDTKVKEKLLKSTKNDKSQSVRIEYEVRNESDESKTITITIPFNKDTDSTVTSDKKFTYTKGNLVTFTLTLQPNSKERFEAEFHDIK